MKLWIAVLCLTIVAAQMDASATVWQPSAGHTQIPIWPSAAPNPQSVPGPETATQGTDSGHAWTSVTNVTQPTMTVYAPEGKNTGAAVVVIPGGGFQILAMNLEGTEVCDWLTSRGITCVLLKYRVPSVPYVWKCDCRPNNLTTSIPSLQDAQRTVRLVRAHADQWHIDPHKIGVLGFSAGGYLVAEVSTHFKHRWYTPIDAVDDQSSRPDFAVGIYPGHLATDNDTLNPNVAPPSDTPPTFLLQAEDDNVDGVHQSLVYYNALRKAGVPAELHVYAQGGHAFGLRRTALPISAWPQLVEVWLRTIGMVQD